MKYFRMSYDEIVFRRSYLNLILLNRAIPGFKPLDKKGEEEEKDTSDKGKIQDSDSFFMSLM